MAVVVMSKFEVAVSQLDQAIRLFLEGDHLSSLTLAGAAEEMLGKLSERAGKPVAVSKSSRFTGTTLIRLCPTRSARKYF